MSLAYHSPHRAFFCAIPCLFAAVCLPQVHAEPVPVEAQPLAANVRRVIEALDVLGQPLDAATRDALRPAQAAQDAAKLQAALDARALFVVTINPESRVKVARGAGAAEIQQGGWTACIVKVINEAGVTRELRVTSPQAGPVYSGSSKLSAERMQRARDDGTDAKPADAVRFLGVEMFHGRPMRTALSGLTCEYALALVGSRDAGKREAVVGFDVGQGAQDLAFRGEVAVQFDVRQAFDVKLGIRDHDGTPTTARLTFRDAAGRIFPTQAKRLAPDFFFQEHIYRRDGETVLLPPGKLAVEITRGPEYLVERRDFTVGKDARLDVKLRRWVEPERFGFFSGDHHIHGAGCAHYTSPTEGVTPEDMLRQCEGEALNVGHVLTWGPCFDFQRKFFLPRPHDISGPRTILKYDMEISGFGSDNFGHVCLLNLRDHNYPGSDGTKTKGWPKWTTPALRWAKAQGAVTGFAHSGSGLEINSASATRRIFSTHDADKDARLTAAECAAALLPEAFEKADADRDGALREAELIASHERAADILPNVAVPEMNGVGAMEAPVAVAHGVCDFISAMDTPRIAEWNMWYHLLNCGFALKVSGETDFPCMSGTRVGQGRVYVQLGSKLDFTAWCEALRAGRSYVSDGFAHALDFRVGGIAPGFGDVALAAPGKVRVTAQVAFAADQPDVVAHGKQPAGGARFVGDTVVMHGAPTPATTKGGVRRVELIVNGVAVASRDVPADGAAHDLVFDADITRSSWVALRHFPQMHTNPVNLIVAGKPIRISRDSARWCIECVEQLWRQRAKILPPAEFAEAEKAFGEAKEKFRVIAAESPR